MGTVAFFYNTFFYLSLKFQVQSQRLFPRTVHLDKLSFLIVIKPFYRTQTRRRDICANRNT